MEEPKCKSCLKNHRMIPLLSLNARAKTGSPVGKASLIFLKERVSSRK